MGTSNGPAKCHKIFHIYRHELEHEKSLWIHLRDDSLTYGQVKLKTIAPLRFLCHLFTIETSASAKMVSKQIWNSLRVLCPAYSSLAQNVANPSDFSFALSPSTRSLAPIQLLFWYELSRLLFGEWKMVFCRRCSYIKSYTFIRYLWNVRRCLFSHKLFCTFAANETEKIKNKKTMAAKSKNNWTANTFFNVSNFRFVFFFPYNSFLCFCFVSLSLSAYRICWREQSTIISPKAQMN